MPDFVPTDEQIDAAERALHRALSIGQQGGYRRVLAEVLVAVGPMVRRDALAEASTQIKAKRGEYAEKRAASTDHDVIAFYAAKHDACDDLLAVLARLGGVEKAERVVPLDASNPLGLPDPHVHGIPAGGVSRETKPDPRLALPTCETCGHVQGYHRHGYVDGRLRDWTPCQHKDCACAGFSDRHGGVTYDGRDAERYQGQIVARKEPQMVEDSGCSHPADAIRWNPKQQVIQCQACGEAMLVTPSGDVYPTPGGVEKETP